MMVDADASSLRFVSIKAGAAGAGGIVEVHRFDRFKGGLDAKGTIWLDIDLASVRTGIDLRDERLRTMLFDVAASPSATFTARIDPATLDGLRENGSLDLDLAGYLRLAGQSQPMQAALRITRLPTGSLQVTTRAPIVVDAQAFGLQAGVEALRQVMGLNFLSTAAPVTLNMVLRAPG
ncbi:YceI family protein [Leptothrix sp. BB-4]